MSRKLFITGTGTDVGKTVATAGIASVATASGLKTAVLKPIQTGVEEYTPDLCEVRRIAPGIMNIPQELATPYEYKLPASPHLASKEENSRIDIAKLTDTIVEVESRYSPDLILIEGAGGVMVPIKKDFLFLDLLRIAQIPAIVVATSGLGTINHTLLTLNILKREGIETAGIIFNKMPKNPTIIEKDNVRVISEISKIPTLAVIEELTATPPSPEDVLSVFRSQKKLKELLGVQEVD